MSAKLRDMLRAAAGAAEDMIAGRGFTREINEIHGSIDRIEELVEALHERELVQLAALKRWLATYPPTDGDVTGDPELMVIKTARRLLRAQP